MKSSVAGLEGRQDAHRAQQLAKKVAKLEKAAARPLASGRLLFA